MKNQYSMIMAKGHPNACKSGMMKRHRFLMAKKIGRPLKIDEVVHHINGNHKDNRIQNLKLMTHAEHNRLHRIAYLKKHPIKIKTHCLRGHKKSAVGTYKGGGCKKCFHDKYIENK